MLDRKKRGFDGVLVSAPQPLHLRKIHHRVSVEARQIIFVRKLIRHNRLLDFARKAQPLSVFIFRVPTDADENISGKPHWLHIQVNFLRPHVGVADYHALEYKFFAEAVADKIFFVRKTSMIAIGTHQKEQAAETYDHQVLAAPEYGKQNNKNNGRDGH